MPNEKLSPSKKDKNNDPIRQQVENAWDALQFFDYRLRKELKKKQTSEVRK